MDFGLSIIMITLFLWLLVCIYILIRNEWTYRVRMESLDNSYFCTESERFIPYALLPSYDDMCHGKYFYIWDVEKIISKNISGRRSK